MDISRGVLYLCTCACLPPALVRRGIGVRGFVLDSCVQPSPQGAQPSHLPHPPLGWVAVTVGAQLPGPISRGARTPHENGSNPVLQPVPRYTAGRLTPRLGVHQLGESQHPTQSTEQDANSLFTAATPPAIRQSLLELNKQNYEPRVPQRLV